MCIGCDERLTSDLIVKILLEHLRAILQLGHYEFYLQKFQWIKKANNFWTNLHFQIFLAISVLTTFKSLF